MSGLGSLAGSLDGSAAWVELVELGGLRLMGCLAHDDGWPADWAELADWAQLAGRPKLLMGLLQKVAPRRETMLFVEYS